MPGNRYEQILSHLHFVNNYTYQPGNSDKLFKIRPALNSLQNIFNAAADPDETTKCFMTFFFCSIPTHSCFERPRHLWHRHMQSKLSEWSKCKLKSGNQHSGYQDLFLYNQHMGGVDLVDQCVSMYPHKCRNKC